MNEFFVPKAFVNDKKPNIMMQFITRKGYKIVIKVTYACMGRVMPISKIQLLTVKQLTINC